jgi:hypothetical protein
MLKWLKKLKAIVAGYDIDLHNAHARIAALEKLVKDRTNIAVDVGFRSASHVIVIGRYRNADYVQTFAMEADSLAGLIDDLREREHYGSTKRVDAPPLFRAVFERETEWF